MVDNLHGRRYARDRDGTGLVDGIPLVFFHFTLLKEIARASCVPMRPFFRADLSIVVRQSVYRPYRRSGACASSPFAARRDSSAGVCPAAPHRREPRRAGFSGQPDLAARRLAGKGSSLRRVDAVVGTVGTLITFQPGMTPIGPAYNDPALVSPWWCSI